MYKIAILFLVLYFTALPLIFAVSPAIGFYLYEVIYFLNPESRWWSTDIPNIKYSFICVLLMFLSYIYYYKEHQVNELKKIPEFKWLLAIFCSFLVSTIFAADIQTHTKFLFEYIKMCLTMYLGFKLLNTRGKLNYAIYFYFIGAAYIGLEAFNLGRDSMNRVEGIGMVDSPDANTTSASIAASIPLLIYFIWRSKWFTKAMLLILAAFIINGLVLMNSRGAFIGVAIGCFYFLVHMAFSKYKLPYQRIAIPILTIVMLAGTVRLADVHFWERMQTIESKTSKESEGSGGKRINFWLATFDLLEDHPAGVGIYGYQTLSPFYLKNEDYLSSVNGVKIRAVHSIWFQALSEIGWHGFAFFLLLLLSIKKSLSKVKAILIERKDYQQYYFAIALESSAVSLLIASTFIDMFRSQILYWLILFCITFCRITLNQQQDNNAYAEKTI